MVSSLNNYRLIWNNNINPTNIAIQYPVYLNGNSSIISSSSVPFHSADSLPHFFSLCFQRIKQSSNKYPFRADEQNDTCSSTDLVLTTWECTRFLLNTFLLLPVETGFQQYSALGAFFECCLDCLLSSHY